MCCSLGNFQLWKKIFFLSLSLSLSLALFKIILNYLCADIELKPLLLRKSKPLNLKIIFHGTIKRKLKKQRKTIEIMQKKNERKMSIEKLNSLVSSLWLNKIWLRQAKQNKKNQPTNQPTTKTYRKKCKTEEKGKQKHDHLLFIILWCKSN